MGSERFRFKTTLAVFALYGLLTGCAAPGEAVWAVMEVGEEIWAEDSRPPDKWERQGINHYEPIVLMSNEEWIQIKYLTVNDHAMHEEVVHLIKDHCGDSYIETKRQEIEGWTTVDAECTHEPGS